MSIATDQAVCALRALLRGSGDTVDEQWRDWARGLIDAGELSMRLMAGIWQEILKFDSTLVDYITNPVSFDIPAVVVAGSGKETFKTFNVSTAASILAAASGAYVVKGVSRSVSAVSGSTDVLEALGLPICDTPHTMSRTLERDRIAFVSYSTFCPAYAGRYDGVFPFLSPFSFFMPIAVLGVRAASFVYGIAHPDVALAARAIQAARPDLSRGVVVGTELSPREMMDEQANYGTSYTAVLDGKHMRVSRGAHPPAPQSWRTAVAHRRSHEDNAAALVASLAPDGCAECADLVDRNAALILTASHWGTTDYSTALARVRGARLAGRAVRLLAGFQDRRGAHRAS